MPEAGPSGGRGGREFTDASYIRPGSSVAAVRIWTGDLVDAVQMVLRDANGVTYELDKHGGGRGTYKYLSLRAGEQIKWIYGRCGDLVDSINIQTNFNRMLSGGGGGGSTSYSYEFGNILGFKGRAGGYIDAIGVVYG